MNRPGFFDLFSGAGGLGKGFADAGFDPLLAVEIRQPSLLTYFLMVRPRLAVCEDIRHLDPREMVRRAGRPDLIIGCPPCQGFSKLNGRGREDRYGDPRNELALVFARWVNAIRPRVVFFENVPGILRHPIYREMRARIRRTHRIVFEEVVDLGAYGAAVRRPRLILIAVSKEMPEGAAFEPPEPTGHRTVGEVLARYQRFRPGGRDAPPNHICMRVTPLTRERIRRIPKNGGDRSALPRSLLVPCHRGPVGRQRFTDVLSRLRADEPAPYLTSGWHDVYRGRYIHPWKDRPLTAREAAALMSFPDDFVFEGTFSSWTYQIGEAFPPEPARRFAEAIRRSFFKGDFFG
ncbi:DNA cytosine methyltransferase [Thermoflexus sp.]|uniref:DNA cytosine methyltransferase n=1 Tax=Thermoflexus sp. TaxID=1969742 RepID=UPI002ADE5F30|nr:DNA cytosine methyltransferase [Thermoflexus sp.]